MALTLSVVAALAGAGLRAQSREFEVASLKPSPPGAQGGGVRPAPGGERYVATNAPLKLMLAVAYQVKAEQIQGGPDWINTDGFDMNAKAEKASTPEELHLMLQNLLAERFKLKFHQEKKEMAIYALTVDKGGPRMTPHQSENAGEPWIELTQEKFLHQTMHAKFVTMQYFAWRLSTILDRPVVDMTKLQGGYDFEVSYTREPPPNITEKSMINGEAVDLTGPSIFESIIKQLGLRLERQKGPVETMIIDHVERPAEN